MEMNNRKLPGCINQDGTEQREAVPDEWGQASFVSALVEGLAGVVGKNIQFNSVEISPRWYFAGVCETTVSVGYGIVGSHVFYHYVFNPDTRKVLLSTDGKFEYFTIRVPLSSGVKPAFVMINGKRAKEETNDVNGSKYLVINGKENKNKIKIQIM